MLLLLGCAPGESPPTVALTDSAGIPIVRADVYPARAGADVLFDWSAVTVDDTGAPFAPDTQTTAFFYLIQHGGCPTAVAETYLDQSDLSLGWAADVGGATSVTLTDLGVDLTYFTERSDRCWLFFFPSVQIFVEPLDDDPHSTVALHDGWPEPVAFSAPPTPVAAGSGLDEVWSFDWSALTVDSVGETLVPRAVDTLGVYRYDADVDLTTVDPRDPAAAATGVWTEPAPGTAVDTTGLGDDFPGFDEVSTWVVALWEDDGEWPTYAAWIGG